MLSPAMPSVPLWKRQGLLLPPGLPGNGWSNHCQMPTPVMLPGGELMRMFFCARDENNRSHMFYVDLLAQPPWSLVSTQATLVLSPGLPGTFDAVGVMPSSLVQQGEELWMYYIGWSQRLDVPYHNAIGIARSFDNGTTFERFLPGPVVGTSLYEPYFCGTADVEQRTQDDWVMWYMSATEWRMGGERAEPRYNLKRASSKDGIHWDHGKEVAIDFLDDEEGGIARATVLQKGGHHWMWYCYRGASGYRGTGAQAYRIGVAWSPDGDAWERLPGQQVFKTPPAAQDFDAHMQCYPIVFNAGENSYLFYNGSDFGQTGIGVAQLVF